MIPSPFEFVLLCLIAGRVWKLIGDDRILDRPREWALDRLNDERGAYWGDFIVCPWCAGFWVSGIVVALYYATLGHWPHGGNALMAALGVWFACSGVVGLFGMVVERLKPSSD